VDEELLRRIAAEPDRYEHRLVYADWLEERGDPRAAFLRLQVALLRLPHDAPGYDDRLGALRAASERLASTQAGWLARLDRTIVENCEISFRFRCPRQWASLQRGDDDRVRYCTSCERQVHYCTTAAEAREHAYAGHCVAVGSFSRRTPGDVSPPELDVVGSVAVPEPSMGAPLPPPPEPRRRWWQVWRRRG
jgi:uncharacterized protein (TIGR02996 family)